MKKKRRAGLALAVAGLMALGWAYGNLTIDVQRIEFYSKAIPAAFDGFKAAVLADIHGRVFGKESSRLIEATAELEPDIILLAGDLIDRDEELSMLPPLLAGLVDIAPVFYVTGNHEWVLDRRLDLMAMLEEYGVIILSNEYRVLEREGQSLVLAGVDDPNGPYDMKTPAQLVDEIRSRRPGDFLFMLSHRNTRLDMWAELGVELVACGHGHGGIVRIPFVGGLIANDLSLFPKHTSGLYHQGETAMVVSRGLGNVQINCRVFNRPHIPLIILRSGEGENRFSD